MRKPARDRLVVGVIVFTLVFYLTARPTLNAADPESLPSRGPRSVAERLFEYANELSRALGERPFDERSASDYNRALDAYAQVNRISTDSYFSAESLAKMADLQRQMADATNDSALYQQSIETFRKIVTEHPQSTFVGDALISIAQIYEENLQDLDGAAAAYRDLIHHFPSSVMAREARAVLARFEAQLANRPVDVLVSAGKSNVEATSHLLLTNVRNFSGPDYARVVIDLSNESAYSERLTSGNRLNIHLKEVHISPSLYGRRFIVADSTLLKRITVSEGAKEVGTQVEIEVSSLSNYSMFKLSNPERVVIDLHAAGTVQKYRLTDASDAEAHPGARSEASDIEHSAADRMGPNEREREPSNLTAKATRPGRPGGRPILSLPEITDPILPFSPTDTKTGTAVAPGNLTVAGEAKAADAPIKCVVIDPGHGGHDTGTISASGLREKDLVLDVARRLKAYIKRNYPDVEVILTRDSDRFISLEERTAIANSRRADLFISIHANASESRMASGVETYFVSPDRARPIVQQPAASDEVKPVAESPAAESPQEKPQPVYASVTVGNRVAESRELARYIQAGLVRGIGAHSPRTAANRGVKHAAFKVLLGSAMPSVLAEVSFMSNPRDEALLQTSQFRERIAASLFGGLNAYLKKNRAAESKTK